MFAVCTFPSAVYLFSRLLFATCQRIETAIELSRGTGVELTRMMRRGGEVAEAFVRVESVGKGLERNRCRLQKGM